MLYKLYFLYITFSIQNSARRIRATSIKRVLNARESLTSYTETRAYFIKYATTKLARYTTTIKIITDAIAYKIVRVYLSKNSWTLLEIS